MKKTTREPDPKVETKPAKTPAKSALKTQQAEPENLTLDEVRELINLIAEKQFTEFELERGQFRLRLGRGNATNIITEPLQHAAVAPAATTVAPTFAPIPAPEEAELYIITSPTVGIFYRAPVPDAEPFVSLGDPVSVNQKLCIIEAMKLMNDVKSEVSGTIAKIFVKDKDPVDFGKPLFGIKV